VSAKEKPAVAGEPWARNPSARERLAAFQKTQGTSAAPEEGDTFLGDERVVTGLRQPGMRSDSIALRAVRRGDGTYCLRISASVPTIDISINAARVLCSFVGVLSRHLRAFERDGVEK
jgi:hypothetical protein